VENQASWLDQQGNWLVCCVKGCDEKPQSNGLCINHYRLNRKYGSPVARQQTLWMWRRLSYETRFWSWVRKDANCWNWQASRDQDGYGVFNAKHDGIVYKRAHRYSYALHYGRIPEGMMILHSCDNPSCVRPDHLSLGTGAENMADKIAKGRARVPAGEQHSFAKLTREQAEAILHDPRPYAQLAAEYGVHAGTISSLKNRDSWPELGPDKGAKAKRVSPRRGTSKKGVTPEIVREIRTSTERGIDLAARFGLKPQDITDIRKRRSWAHVT
jgi:hypothetical protein